MTVFLFVLTYLVSFGVGCVPDTGEGCLPELVPYQVFMPFVASSFPDPVWRVGEGPDVPVEPSEAVLVASE